MNKFPQTLTLVISAIGAFALTPTMLGLTGAAAAAAPIATTLAALLSGFCSSRFQRDSHNTIDTLLARLTKPALDGKLPLNHDIENAACNAYRATLFILIEQLSQSPQSTADPAARQWMAAVRNALKKSEPPSWPDFSLTSDDPAATFTKLWSHDASDQDDLFAPELRQKTDLWLSAIHGISASPQIVADAIANGWIVPSNPDTHRTLSNTWVECFREQIKQSPRATTAHLFETLSLLVEGQREILEHVDASTRALGERLIARDQLLLDKLDTLKKIIPVAPDLEPFLEDLRKISKELAETAGGLKATAGSLITTAGDFAKAASEQRALAEEHRSLIEEQRALLAKILDAATQSSRQSSENNLTPGESLQRAKAMIAEESKIPLETLEKMLQHFSTATKADPRADSLDKARAAYGELRLSDGISEARTSGDTAENDLEYMESMEAMARSKKREALQRLFESRKLEGQGLMLAEKFAEAVESYSKALEKISRETMPEQRAELQLLLGDAANARARRSEGAAVNQRRQQAIVAYRDALQVYTCKDFPQQWAMAQHNLAVALIDQAETSDGTEGARLLGEAVQALRDALQVYTRKDFPKDWATTQNNLGNALWNQAKASDSAEGARLLGEAVQVLRETLQVYTRKDFPQQWATAQNNLGNVLWNQAKASDGAERERLLGEAVQAYRETLQVYTRKDFPQQWAATQNNLGATLTNQAEASDGAESARLHGEAVQAYRDTLLVYTHKDFPQQWAMTQNNLGATLMFQAKASDGAEGARLLGEAVQAYRDALLVYSRKDFPQGWAMTQNNLAITLTDQAMANDGAEGVRLLGEAVQAFRDALLVYTRKDFPQDWAMIQYNLAKALLGQVISSEGAERARLLKEAIGYFEAALEVYTKEHFSTYHIQIQNFLSLTRSLLAEMGQKTPPIPTE